MIICPNCGSTNENESQFCRKCGVSISNVFLPPKIKIPIIDNEQEVSEELSKESEKLEISAKKTEEKEVWSPNINAVKKSDLNLQEIPKIIELDFIKIKEEKPPPILQEIPPKPFSIHSLPTKFSSSETIQTKKLPSIKKEGLSAAMTTAIQTLTNNIAVKNKKMRKSQEADISQQKVKYEKIDPNNLNEILIEISNLDQNIKASVIINSEGIVLASALSEKVNNSLFASIGKTLLTIGEDVVNALNTGILKSITINGTQGRFNIAPIVKDVILLILSGSRVKSGIIHIAVSLFKKQFKKYLDLKEK